MTDWGTLLAKARLSQGLTIEEMSERTKIKPHYLHAIEAGEFHLLPGQAYIKPFLRTYTRSLGLEDHLDSLTNEASPCCEMLVNTGIRERRERTRKIRRLRFILHSSLLLIALGGVSYLIYRLLNI